MCAMAKGSLEGSEVLLLEDEPLLRKRLAAFLGRQGAQVTALDSLAAARNAAAAMPFDYALLDINLPDGSGLDLLREHAFGGATSVVVMTAEGSVQIALEAMRIGASDFLSKPVDPEALVLVLARARKAGQSQRIDQYVASRAPDDASLFFGAAMRPVRDELEIIRQAESGLTANIPPVLIEGETGTGKTTVARWLHNHSRRAQMPYVDVNCSALPEQLAESELFGHERGSFTDAKEARIGLFEAADGGTLFLDEIPSLSASLQAKVLKAVEEGRIRRVGASRDIAVDVRLIAATNRDLRELSAKGEFREDLLQRLDLLRVKLPPLRDWGEDIGRLAGHLLKGLARKYRLGDLRISPAGFKRLQSWRWPGNIRELSHELERAVVLSMGGEDLEFSNLPCANPSGSTGAAATTAATATDDWFIESFRFPEEGGFDMETAILRIINHALAQTDGNVSAAARLLGVPRDYIRYRIKKA